jgi:hypothetical protein
VRFDDSLKTVLSAETSSGFGAQSAWRQLVDLIGRRRVAADEAALAHLRMLRAAVSEDVRAASARAVAVTTPPAALVGLFGEDVAAVAAPVLRMAVLTGQEWQDIVPRLSPMSRSVLRHRRDLPPEASRALEVFGSTDFVLEDASVADTAPAPLREPLILDAPLSEAPFVASGQVARGLPAVAEALRQAEPPADGPQQFDISDLVARIAAFNREREAPAPASLDDRAPAAEAFRFETDAGGTIRWVGGVSPTAIVGLCFAHIAPPCAAQVDASVSGAYRGRGAFRDARLAIGGRSDAAGEWRMSGTPAFDPATGRFVGYRGSARRPRHDESAAPAPAVRAASDSLRQLVHELRTPTSAIAGFAEMIESELLGAVPPSYRARAATIRTLASDLVEAVDDLDTAARIDAHALDLRRMPLALAPLVQQLVAQLQPLAMLRGSTLAVDGDGIARHALVDDRAAQRVIGRLLAAIVAVSGAGERIGVQIVDAGGEMLALFVDRPPALIGEGEAATLAVDAAGDDVALGEGAPLLGSAFAFRLAHKLAAEMGGSLSVEPSRLTLRLPAAVDRDMGQVSTN